MRKIVLRIILIPLIFISIGLNAEVISLNSARTAAQKFANETHLLFKGSIADFQILNEIIKVSNNLPVYYIFNLSNSSYVIVAADDLVFPILGYSLESGWSNENLPPSLVGWMSDYITEINAIRSSRLDNSIEFQKYWDFLLSVNNNTNPFFGSESKNVLPLLVTKWNQDNLYNYYCPEDVAGPGGRVYAGCVATTMSQIMNYYKYPQNGIGSYGYNSSYGYLSVNFGNTAYKWNEMTNSASTSSYHAIAELNYHCGVAVNMNYSPTGSGAYMNTAAMALQNYFGYTASTSLKNKNSFSTTAWNNLVVAELDAKRPLGYAGYQSSGPGHAFVLDGYQGTNYFHFNWGWGGNYDGYFYLNNLNPGSYNFSTGQQAIIGIYPGSNYPNYCSGNQTLTTVRGVFYDGSGPSNYQSNSNCSWLIAPNTPISKITISFDRFNTESNADKVIIFSGGKSTFPVYATYSGSNLPASVDILSDSVLVMFVSDLGNEFEGFHASYTSVVKMYCTSTTILTNPSGTISDGSGLNQYNENTNCKWSIEPPNAASITLQFTSLSTEPGMDLVKIYDPTTSPSKLLGIFSGFTIPSAVTSNSGKMLVIFTSGPSNNEYGWEAQYTSSQTAINENLSFVNIDVFPNPVIDILHINLNLQSEESVQLYLSDLAGKVVLFKTLELNANSIISENIFGLKAGAYFVRIVTKQGILNKRVIKI